MTADLTTGSSAFYEDSAEIITEPLLDVIDSESFTPRLLALLSNALVWRESRLLRRAFNLGTNDWRVISALSIRPGATSTEISEFVAMNKAVVSKSVNTLIARSLIVPADGPRGSRPLYLTRSGAEMHAQMKPISLRGQEIVLSDLSADEVALLNALLLRLLAKTPDLSRAADTDSDEDSPGA
ncbi:MarR family winged helix-turn-helix transcriptional regulator [Microbacterium sp. DT81.1]|uniref:MarR family winged helix-turn-helix transcriptional regulator n=1 Tax=Microbacterium sp. DT81.1 TaxID=3393413 RepID=UPI003CEDA3F2